MMNRRNRQKSAIDAGHSQTFERRVMFRVRGVLALVLIVVAALVIVDVQFGQRDDLRDDSVQSLRFLQGEIDRELEQPIDDLRILARSIGMQVFAQTLADMTVPALNTTERQQLQQIVLDFENIISANRGQYLALRFLSLDGRQWAAVTTLNGALTVDTDVRRSPYAVAAGFRNAQQVVAPGDVYIGQTFPGNETRPTTMLLYAPVSGTENLNAMHAVIQMQVALEPVVAAIQAHLNDEVQSLAGRRVLIVSATGDVLLDLGPQNHDAQTIEAFITENTGVFEPRSLSGGFVAAADTVERTDGLDTPWRVVIIDDYASALQRTNILSVVIAVSFVVVAVVLSLLLNAVIRPLLRPLADITSMANTLVSPDSADYADFDPATLVVSDDTPQQFAAVQGQGDEFRHLYEVLGTMTGRVERLNQTIQQQSEQRRRDLDLAAQLGRTLAMVSDMDSLLDRAISLISRTLGHNNAEVYIVDDVGMNALMTYSRRGDASLDRVLDIDSDDPPTRAIREQRPVILNNLTEEMQDQLQTLAGSLAAFPLSAGENVVGALILYNKLPLAFPDDEVPLLQLLADQLASGVYNARIAHQTAERVERIASMNRQLTRAGWENTDTVENTGRAYRYNLHEVTPDESNPDISTLGAISAPITIRGEAIGALTIEPEADDYLTDGDQMIVSAVANRVALAIENARLFQETQVSLAETSTLYQLSRYLNEADSLAEIVEAIIVSVMPDSNGGQVWVFDEYSSYDTPSWIELHADHIAIGSGDRDLVGLRLNVDHHSFFQGLYENRVTLIKDAHQDSRLDAQLLDIVDTLEARAMAVIPLIVRGSWRGVVTITYDHPRDFSERESGVYSALIDQAGVAIDNRLLLRSTEEERQRNENLYAASRIINQAQNAQELVYAVVATTNAPSLQFALALLEGDLDRTGWPTQFRVVAQSAGGLVHPRSDVYPILIHEESPLRRREPQLWLLDDHDEVDETTADGLLRWMSHQHYRFAAVFPLFSGKQPIALFVITSHTQRDLSAEDYEVYRALTGQMSTQLQIRNLLERTEQALSETQRLYMASSAINSASDTHDIFRVAREHLTRPFQPDGEAAAVLHDITLRVLLTAAGDEQGGARLEVAYAWNSELHELRDETGQLLSAAQYPYKQLVQQADDLAYIADARVDDPLLADFPDFRAALLERRTGSMIVAPVQSRLRWFGVLVLESNRPAAFGEQYQRFLVALADQVSIAVENKQLFREAQLEAERAQAEAQRALALVEASQFANRIGEFLELSLGEVFERVAQAAAFNRWLLVMYDTSRSRLNLLIARMPGMDTGDDIYFGVDQPLPMVMAAERNETFIINEIDDCMPQSRAQYETLTFFYGRHIAAPVSIGDNVLGALVLGRNLDEDPLDERDAELVMTLAGQVAVALENRRLFEQTEREQQRLESILATMPAGMLVLDPHTLQPLLFNERVEEYLGYKINRAAPFDVTNYRLFRTGTNMNYPRDEMPILVALQDDRPAFSDDVTVERPDGPLDLMINAAPIHDNAGRTTAIVAAFQDISNLRTLESTLQENLRETVALYEAQRQLAAAGGLDEVLDVILEQLFMLQPDEGFVISAHGFTDDDSQPPRIERYMMMLPDSIAPYLPLLDDYEIVRVDDIDRASLDETTLDAFRQQGLQRFICVPLRTRQRQLGWIMVMHAPDHVFSSEQERIIEQLSDVATTAIDNRLLIRSQSENVREIGLLYNATATISRSEDIEQLSVVLQAAVDALDATATFAYLNPGMIDESRDRYPLFVVNRDDSLLDMDALQDTVFAHPVPLDGLFIEDTTALADPGPLVAALAEAGVGAVMIATLRVKEQPGGRIVALYREPRRFTENTIRYVNTITDSASVVADNMLLLSQVQATLEQTSILYQASRALTDATTEQDILDVVVDHLVQSRTTQAFIALLEGRNWDAPGITIRIAASWSEDDFMMMSEGLSLGREQFPAWDLLSAPEVVAISDTATDPALDELTRAGLIGLGLRSAVVLPLRVANRAIGALWMGSDFPQHFGDREVRTFQSFAEQASLSIEASYLLQQTERRARQLTTSAQVSQSASQILDLEVLLPRVVNLIMDSFDYDHVQIFLMDERDEWAVLRASTGEAGRTLLSINHRLAKGSSSVIGQVTANAEPTIALDTADADVIHRPNPHLPLTRSEMALPLIIKGQVVGALDVQSNQPNAFNEEDITALTTLAAQISVAIDNANNYAATERQAERMSFLFDTTTAAAASAADSLDEALHTVASELHRAFDSTAAMIYLPQHYIDHDDNTYTALQIAALVGSDQPLSGIEQVDTTDVDNLLAMAYATAEPIIVNQISAESGYLAVTDIAESAVIAPLVTGVRVAGLIVIESARAGAYDDDSVRLLRALAGSLSAIVQSAQLLQQLTSTNEQLRELDKVKSDFLANMSHELRTPLNSIIGFSRVMLKGIDGPLTEMQEQDLTTIFTSGQHLLMLINDVLDQAKIASGKMEVKPEYFDVKPLVEAVKSIGIGLVKDKPISINVEYAPGLPQAYGDEFRIRQVLINIVSNAAKFTQDGSITLQAYTEPHPQTGAMMVRIDITDTGIGIAEKDLPLLFEAFRQVDSSLTRTVGGTGLGLPIAKSLIEIQGGQMMVASEVNVGSTFSITIPVEPPAEADTDDSGEWIEGDTLPDPAGAGASVSDDHTATKPNLPAATRAKVTTTQPMAAMPPKRDIVLIEDNRDMVDQFRRTLQREGFEVQTADHPAYAEAMVGNLRPTLVVMDVNFAEGQGWDILQRLKSRDDTVDIPVIVVTLSADEQRALDIGAFAFVQRPFAPDDLVKIVLHAEEDNNTHRILVISDNGEEVAMIEELLKLEDLYRIYTGTGAEGMSLVARRRPDLIIFDPALHEMDGFALLAELRSHPETAAIPVILVGEGEIQAEDSLLEGVSVMPRTNLTNGSSRAFLREIRTLLGG